MTGFTGVIWGARSTEKLALDLRAGPGPGPLTDAGFAWHAVSSDLSNAATEYTSILTALGVNWRSPRTDAALETLTRLTSWFAEAAAAAGRNARRAEGQAAAVTVARLSMPDLVEVDVAEKAMQVATVVGVVAPGLVGAAARAEQVLHDQKLRAARVMETYEAATESAARPWEALGPAPDLVFADPLGARRSAQQSAVRTSSAHMQSPALSPSSVRPVCAPMGFTLVECGTTPAADKTRYAPTVLAGGVEGGVPVSETDMAAVSPSPNAPLGPIAAHAGMAPERQATRSSVSPEQAGVAYDRSATVERPMPTWAELAVAEHAVAHHVPNAAGRPLDPMYLTGTLARDLGREP
ncbi:PPE domain-containing protein [Gordonia sp. SID5947]|uniref:PPE domain-containing protein n=1 Tax=Gordonia sp. SID5947 TaxID=2690315 RepID=UPI00136CD067|nr:PPE domain-containing protein [Gordonia sp. SID5947]MYR08832.1 PPE domain-containing protein [Gordonia sp. SID5947]